MRLRNGFRGIPVAWAIRYVGAYLSFMPDETTGFVAERKLTTVSTSSKWSILILCILPAVWSLSGQLISERRVAVASSLSLSSAVRDVARLDLEGTNADAHVPQSNDPPLPPTNLQQHDDIGMVAVGEEVGSYRLGFHFQVIGQAGGVLVPQVELRTVDQPFDQPNLIGDPVVATGDAQWISVSTNQTLSAQGYHWRARVVGSLGASVWQEFGDNSDYVDPPNTFADADFYYLYEPLLTEPKPLIGFESLSRIAQLPFIVPGSGTYQVSSFDRTEGNMDGGSSVPGLESYFYREDGAEVVLEVKAPGQITRIWFADSNDPAFPNTRLQFFFDGASVPSYEISIANLVSGRTPPFVSPLVLNADRSSGGLISYVPIPFREGVKVRLAGPHNHYQITYQLFSPDISVRTFTGTEDYTLAQHIWQNVGEDPKPVRGNQVMRQEGSIAPGASLVLPGLHGCGVLQSLKLSLPQLRPSIMGTPPLDDQVRAHRSGASQFGLLPQVSQSLTRLRIRRGCREAPQVANVYLEDQLLGTWARNEGNDRYRWCEDTFVLPTSAIHAGNPLQLRIASIHADHAWEEARYWLEQQVDGIWTVVDELDVGDSSSEQAHAYQITGQMAAGWRTYTYPPQLSYQPDSEALLAGLRLQIMADDNATPYVDVPVGAFFGSAVGETDIASLLVGMDPEAHTLYSYWPIPYADQLQIELVNSSQVPVEQISAELAYAERCYPFLGRHVGYFRVFESLSRPTSLDEDHPLLDVHGAGRIVGLHLLVHSGEEAFIEGDERWHLDGTTTPQVRGTGTEDIFNGGWYYNRGRIITAVHGANSTRMEGWIDQYRLYIADAISFGDHVHGGIEHGGVNDINTDYSSWTYAYLASDLDMLQQDTVDLSDETSMVDHGVATSGSTITYTLTAQFEGDDDRSVTATSLRLYSGAALTTTLAINPRAQQVILRRRYDQGFDNERLQVRVDGQIVGEWLDGGRNIARRWRESTYLLPGSLTQGKRSIVLRFEPMDWNSNRTISLSQITALSLYPAWRTTWLPLMLCE